MKPSLFSPLVVVLLGNALATHAESDVVDMGDSSPDPGPVDELSLVTKYVYAGMGYNLLMANPEGDFNRGGIDPGIKVTNSFLNTPIHRGSKHSIMASR